MFRRRTPSRVWHGTGQFQGEDKEFGSKFGRVERAGPCPEPLSTACAFVSGKGQTLRIHDQEWNPGFIQKKVAQCREIAWHWEKKNWRPRDTVVRKNNGHISFDVTLAENPDFQLVKGGWARDPCAICRWILRKSPEAERSVGYTNGRDWVCTECYEKFLHGPDYFADAYRR